MNGWSFFNPWREENSMTPKYESEYMNEILDRLGCKARAIPGTQVGPTFYQAFTAIIDRLDALEHRFNLDEE